MFERYTEKARRVIFFARYEASQFGASQIEAEHILLGLMREDKNLTARFFKPPLASIEAIRKEIEGRATLRERISTSVDLPLSTEAKRVLAFAAEESDRLGHHYIGTEHLLLGLLREENSMAAEILHQHGLELDSVRQDVTRQAEQEQTARLEARAHAEPRPADFSTGPYENWIWELSEACTDLGLLTPEELADEFQKVTAMRRLSDYAEALLRLLAAKGLAEPQRLLALALELSSERKLQAFIEKLRREHGAK
jgi:ATP-dependent Clp protease ATP-binding subunit ClpA